MNEQREYLIKQMGILSAMSERLVGENLYAVAEEAHKLTDSMVEISRELRVLDGHGQILGQVLHRALTDEGLRLEIGREPTEEPAPDALQRMADVFNGPEAER